MKKSLKKHSSMKQSDWDALAKGFETEVCDITREETKPLIGRLVARARLPKNATLVDLGCGIGTFIQRFAPRFARIIGVEFAPGIMARARRRCAGIKGTRWLRMDIPRSVARIGRKGDFTACLNVITQEDEKKRDAIWKSVAGTTKKGGYTLIVVASLEAARMIDGIVRKSDRHARSSLHPGGLVNRGGALQKHFERSELRQTIEDYGFHVERISRAYYPWAKEGMRETSWRRAHRPWDWACLARRV